MDLDEEKRSVTQEGAIIATGGTDGGEKNLYTAETEVTEGKRKRKNYTESYKKKVIEHLSVLRRTGSRDIGGYLRREGLYYRVVREWEKKYQMSENKKTKASASSSRERELEEKVKMLEKELEMTKKKLQKSEMIIDFQKKISLLLNPDQEDQSDQEK